MRRGALATPLLTTALAERPARTQPRAFGRRRIVCATGDSGRRGPWSGGAAHAADRSRGDRRPFADLTSQASVACVRSVRVDASDQRRAADLLTLTQN